MKYQYLLMASLAFGLVHCSKDSGGNSDDGDIVVIDLPMQIKQDAKLEPAQKEVAEAVKAKKGISFRKVTQLMIEKHVKAQKNSSVSSSTIQAFVSSIAPGKSLNPSQTKIHYEDQISKKHGGKSLIYNASKNNVVDIYSENRVQCYSGTYMYELVRRQQKPSTFRAGNEVVIFTEGHVQPGYMIKKDKGYALIAIETTVKGGGRTYYGAAESLSSGVIVVDAELFALTEVFADEISNPVEVANAAIKATAKKYGIPVQESGLNVGSGVTSSSDKRELNQSIFAYGNPDLSSVDKEREDSGDDGKQSDDIYFQGMKSASVLPFSLTVQRNKCRILDGLYRDLNSEEELTIRSFGCEKFSIQHMKFQMILSSGIYSVTSISQYSSFDVVFGLGKVELKYGSYDQAAKPVELVYDNTQKTVKWGNQTFILLRNIDYLDDKRLNSRKQRKITSAPTNTDPGALPIAKPLDP